MSIQSEIDRLLAAKKSIAASLTDMGIDPPENTTMDQYAVQLAAIAASAPWLPLAGGTMAGQLNASESSAAALDSAQVRNIYAGTDDLIAGTSPLSSGTIYLCYESNGTN